MKKVDICPVAHCKGIVVEPKVMCDRHWRKLPMATRADIFEAWRDRDKKRLKPMVRRIASAMDPSY